MSLSLRCPVCESRELKLSREGWARHLTRFAFVRPLRCMRCLTRFWRLCPVPPGR